MTVKERLDDFVNAGFTAHESVEVTDTDTYHYAYYRPDDQKPMNAYSVSVYDEPVEKHQALLAECTDEFNKAHGIISDPMCSMWPPLRGNGA